MSQQQAPYKAKKKSLLIDEYPIQVLPNLAKRIGLNEAIALQQLHWWLDNPKAGIERNGFKWVYNTYEEWQEDNFPFWSTRTIQRVFLSLEEMGLVISEQLEKEAWSRKKYYRIDYDKVEALNMTPCHHPDSQDDRSDDDKLARSLNESETTTETTQRGKPALDFKNMTVGEARKVPTLKLYADATDYFPGSILWEVVHRAITENKLTFDKLHSAAIAWAGRGFKPSNVQGILEWAVNGIPGGNGTRTPPPPVEIDKFDSLKKMLARQEAQS